MQKRLFLLPLLFVCLFLLQESFAQDAPQWHLPEGVKARIGKGRAHDLAVSPDGGQLAVATGLGIWLYNLTTGAEIALLTGHTDWVKAVAYSPNGKTLTSVSYREILLWNPETQKQKATFASEDNRSIAYSPNGCLLAVGRWQRIDVLDAQTGEWSRPLDGMLTRAAVETGLSETRHIQIAEYAKKIATYENWDKVVEAFRKDAFSGYR